ncbi:hypothetical protein pb186bvf_005342 [Paramecium bursaria]
MLNQEIEQQQVGQASNKVSISQNIDYSDYFELRAVGFVLFGDQQGEQIQRKEFVDLQHNPINRYARITVANNEFSYPAFNGMIADVSELIRKGFVGPKEQFQKEILSNYPQPICLYLLILQAQRVIVKYETKPPVQGQYYQYAGVLEYAVSGWLRKR